MKHQNPHCKEQTSVILAPGEDMGLGVVADHVKGRTETAGNSQDPRTYQTEKEQASVILAPGEDMGLGVVTTIHVKGRTETAENSQDPRTYQTEKEQENTRTQDMHSASTVQAQEKHRSCPADSLIPDSLIPDSKTYTVVAEQPTGAPEQQDIDDGEEAKPGKRQQQSPDWKTARTPLEIGFCKFWDAYPNVRKRAKPAC